MSQNNMFKFQISLKHLSSAVIAIRLWEKPSIKSQISEYFLHHCCSHKPHPHDHGWSKITKTLINEVDSLNLSSNLSIEIQDMIHTIGERIFAWEIFIIKDHNHGHEFAENHYWTAYGTIDEPKICKLVWLTDPYFPLNLGIGRIDLTMYIVNKMTSFQAAAAYVDEDFLRSSINDAAPVMKAFIGLDIANCKLKVNSFIALMMCFIDNRDDRFEGLKLYRSLKNSKYSNAADILFLLSTKNLLVRPAKYFYERLKGNDKRDLLLQAAEESLNKSDNVKGYKIEKLQEVLLYLINQMSHEQKHSFLVKNICKTVEIFVKGWPYQEVCLPILNYVWNSLSTLDQEKLLKTVLNLSAKYIDLQSSLVKKEYEQTLKYILQKTSKESKAKIFADGEYWFSLFQISDFSTMLLILNDADLRDERAVLIMINNNKMLDYFIKGGKFKAVNQYMKKLKFSDEEQKNFKQNYGSIIFHLLMDERLTLADKLSNWCCSSEEEKKNLKKGIDYNSICDKFLSEKNYNFACKFMKWLFDNPEEEKLAKQKWETKDFIPTEFLNLWTQYCEISLKMAKDKCSELLRFFFEPNEMTLFKKEKLIENEHFVEIFCDTLSGEKYFGTIDEIFKFCDVPPNKVSEIKKVIKDNIEWWIELFGARKHKFLIANAIVNWIFKDRKQKNDAIGKFINSANGLSLCIEVLRKRSGDDSRPDRAMVTLLDEWVKPNGDFSRMKEELVKLNENNPGDKYVEEMMSTLDKVKMGKK